MLDLTVPTTCCRDWLMADLNKEHPLARPGDLHNALHEERMETMALAWSSIAPLVNSLPSKQRVAIVFALSTIYRRPHRG